jgi:PAS domain S-box-containing protein
MVRRAKGSPKTMKAVFGQPPPDLINQQEQKPTKIQYEEEETFRLLVQSVKDYAIFLLDTEGCVRTWNDGAERIKGYKAHEIIGKHFSTFYPPEPLARNWPAYELEQAIAQGSFEDEAWRVRKDGTLFWANVVITSLRNKDGILWGFSKVTRDLTERRIAEQKLRESEERYRLLVAGVKDYGIFMLDRNGNILTWNAGAEHIKGYSAAEIIGQHFSKFYLEEAVRSRWPQRELEIATLEGTFSDEGWRVRKDGSVFWANVVITALRGSNGEVYGFSKVTRDLSQRREWEEQIQKLNNELRARISQLAESHRLIELRTVELQNLSGRLLRIQDEERRRIARELHDELGQELTGLKLMLENAETKLGGNGQLTEPVKLADKTIQIVRNLSYLLHPPLLDEAGLLSALHWLVTGLQKRSGIQINLVLKPASFPRLPPDIETTIFRIVQEALTNIYRHAESKGARVELEKQPEYVTVRVRDYGKGIPSELSQGRSAPLGVGIGGMRERVHQFGGQLKILAAEPGTLIDATLPLFPVVPNFSK